MGCWASLGKNPEVLRVTAGQKQGTVPKPLCLGTRAVGAAGPLRMGLGAKVGLLLWIPPWPVEPPCHTGPVQRWLLPGTQVGELQRDPCVPLGQSASTPA